jgi:hypothetical protein
MRIVREFRHLKLMKRAGRGNIFGGLASTKAGDPLCRMPSLSDPWNQPP